MSLTSSNKENAADATDNDNINASYLHVATAVPSPVIRHAIQLQLLPERQSKSLSIVIGRETSLELLSLDTNHVNGVRLASLHRQPIHGTIIRMAALPRWRTIGTASSTIDLTANSEGEEEEDSASISTCTDSCPQCSVTSMNATSTAMDDGDIMSLDDAINEVTHQFPHSLTGYRRWPRSSCIQSRDLLVVTSDAGLLSLLAYGPITAMDYQWTPATASVENATHAPYSSDPSSRFYTVQDIYLGRPGLPFDATGHHLCVDPRSRAIAVAAWQDHIKVFLLKSGTNTSVDVGRHAVSTTSSASMSCPHGYTQCSTKVDPQSEPVDLFARQLDITEEFSLITGMDFLWPSITHMKRILLAVTYTSDRDATPYLTIYQIMADNSNDNPTRYARLPLGRENTLITHLFAIPTFHEQLVFITDRKICCISAEDAHNGNNQLNKVNLPSISTNSSMLRVEDDTPSVALITSVAVRISDEYRTRNDTGGMVSDEHISQGLRIYLGSDYNGLYRLVIRANRFIDLHHVALDRPTTVGGVPPAIGEALLCLRSNTSGDLLLMSGEMCDGQVVMISNQMQGRKLYSKLNWASLVDFVMCDAYNDRQKTIYACCGAGAQGTLREFRHGLSMNIHIWSDADFDGLNGLWNLQHDTIAGRDRYLVLSYISDTRVFSVTYDNGYEMEDISESSGFRLDTRTLLACSFAQGDYWLQVHPNGVRVNNRTKSLDQISYNPLETDQWQPSSNHTISKAAWYEVEQNETEAIVSRKGYILATLIDHNGMNQCVWLTIDVPEITASHTLALSHEPTSIHLFKFNNTVWAAIATRLPTIYLMRKTDNDISIQHTLSLDNIGLEGLNLTESLLYIQASSKHQGFLLAGLRDGSLMSWQLEQDNTGNINDGDHSTMKCSPRKPRIIGSLPVKLRPWPLASSSNTKTTMLLVLSDRPWRLHVDTTNELAISSILYTRPDTIIEATGFRYSSSGYGLIFTVNGRLGMATVGRHRRANVRRVVAIHSPRRILFDQTTRKLLIACRSSAEHHLPVIKVVDPIRGHTLVEHTLHAHETVHSMTEWVIPKGSHTYRYICVGTNVGNSNSSSNTPLQQPQNQQGRLLIYSLKRAMSTNTNESIKLELRTVWIAEVPRPVYRICPIKESYLLVASGKTLYVYQLNMEQRKLVKICKEDMRFPITKIAAYDNYFIVGCQRASFSLFMLDLVQSRITFIQSDHQPRMPIECIMGKECMIGTDQSGHIIGLTRNTHTIEESLTTIFSMQQPDIIYRMQPGTPFYPLLDDTSDAELKWPMTCSEPLVASSMLGAFLVLRRIDARSLGGQLLEQLQHVMELHPLTRPVLGHALVHNSSRKIVPYNVTATGYNYALYGDFLDQYLALSIADQYDILNRLKERISWMISTDLVVEPTIQEMSTMSNTSLHQWLCRNLTLLRS